MEGIKVSIVIPTYNRVAELEKLLNALEDKTISHIDIEVIVIDDASTDGTREFLKSYRPSFDIKLIFHNANRGSAMSRNDGIKVAKGDIILFFDDDLIPSKEIVQNHLKYHIKDNCAVIGNIKYRETFKTRWVSRYLSTRGVHKIKNGGKIPFKCFWTSNASIKKESLLKVGFFDERFKGAGGEDTELAYRLEQLGVEFVFAKDALCYHKPVSLEELLKKQELFVKNALPILIKKDSIYRKIFRVDLLRNPFVQIITLPVFYFPIYMFANILKLFFLPPFIIDYLLFCKRRRIRNCSRLNDGT